MNDGYVEPGLAETDSLISAVRGRGYVRGFTHKHYRYPARFSPEFAREAIASFTRQGQLVLDPFMGGGTTAVEALAAGRRFLGCDTNALAHFVSHAKTDVLENHDEAALFSWILELPFKARSQGGAPSNRFPAKNVPPGIAKAIGVMLEAVGDLRRLKQRRFARCSILRAAQWALDCKLEVPTASEFRSRHQDLFFEMLAGHQEFSERVTSEFGSATAAHAARELRCMDSGLLSEISNLKIQEAPSLVLTSPPYLGVHVLYHRWQVCGRKETEAPYWIANQKAAPSGIPFTFAHRHAKKSDRYYDGIRRCFKAVYDLLRPGGCLVQLVAFSKPEEQLGSYLEVMKEMRFEECEMEALSNKDPLARKVPNRKWYALFANQSESSREFMLVHRKAPKK